jgi:hypothetical protein
MAPLQQPSGQRQKIKLLRIGYQILRLHTYKRRYQTTITKGQCNPSSHTTLQCKASPILHRQAKPLQSNNSSPFPSSNTTYSTYQEEHQI